MVSHGRYTDDGEVPRSKELAVMGRKMRKLSAQRFCVRDSSKEKHSQKASIDPGFTSLLDSEDLKVMSTDQE
jgi:hypothetical protein